MDHCRMESPWTLGNFIEELGGAQAKSKKTFGVCVPPTLEISDDYDDVEDTDNVSMISMLHQSILL